MTDRLFPDAPTLPGPRFPVTDRQAEIMDLAHRVAVLADANAARHDRDATFPHDTFEAIRQTPLLGLTVPESFGGMGADSLETMLAVEIIAQGDASVALILTMHLGHVAGVAANPTWPEGVRDQFFRDIIEKGALYNTAASEPEMGSPSRGGHFATRAVKQDDGSWRINGRKAWGTGGPGLGYAGLQLSLENDEGELERGMFLVPMDADGITIEDNWDNLGMRASGSNDLVFTEVTMPDSARLPIGGKPEGSPWSVLTSALYLGIGVAARNWAIAYAKDRRPTSLQGKAIAELEGIQRRVADIEMLLLQARSSLYGTVQQWELREDLRDSLGAEFAAAKVICTNNAIAITDQAMRIAGSVGMQKQHPLERYFRDVRAGLGNPPLDDVAQGIIARNVLGL